MKLNTVCEEAACPNIGECWSQKHATVMILGDTCTRACAFCNVKTGMPGPVDLLEPAHVAEAAGALGLEHIVITSVDRDDLPDGGAGQFVRVIEELRKHAPKTTIEILTPDFRNKAKQAVEMIVDAGPGRVQPQPRNRAAALSDHPAGRALLSFAAAARSGQILEFDRCLPNPGVMVGLGETALELHQVLDDMRSAGVDFLTVGQYLQPTPRHAKVIEFVPPATFAAYAAVARSKGFLQVAASPLTRSSYHAGDDFAEMQAKRAAQGGAA